MAVVNDADRFQPGKILQMTDGQTIEIVKFIAGGGQGDVYKVKYCGEFKALKWYTCRFPNEDSFYENLKRNVMNGSPAPQFAWPLALTKRFPRTTDGSFDYESSFGYVMDLIPDGYYEVDEYILTNVKFSSFKAATEACLQIVSAFRGLHSQGLAYQDLNGGNFAIDPIKGKVMICDNDNVAPNGTSTGILGTPGYIAPEVIIGKDNPNTRTDQFSLAVLIFMILCMNHPLEGKRWVDATVLTDEMGLKLYGYNPLFICDPYDNSNGPVPNIHKNLLNRWQYLPQYMKDIFIRAFSQESFKNPSRRPQEIDWVEALCRFRSEIAPCSCGRSEVFLLNGNTTNCDVCGKPFPVLYKLKLPEYTLPIVNGGRIYQCQIETCNIENALKPVAALLQRDANTFGIKNKTQNIWQGITPSGNVKRVEPEDIIPVKPGIKIKINNTELEIQ